ncbi:hypothetical protein M758_4G121000 [Ceratodon purpureus]|nr:hypothetical protein M758_4G121000 [Ceratodon purpureus]
MNNVISYVQIATPVITALAYRIKGVIGSTPPDFSVRSYNVFWRPVPTSANYESPVYVFRKNSVVDVIVQNANTLTVNYSEIHPLHLHLTSGCEGLCNPERHASSSNLLILQYRPRLRCFLTDGLHVRLQHGRFIAT